MGGHFHIVMTHDGRNSAVRDQGNGSRMLLEPEELRSLTLLFLHFFTFHDGFCPYKATVTDLAKDTDNYRFDKSQAHF